VGELDKCLIRDPLVRGLRRRKAAGKSEPMKLRLAHCADRTTLVSQIKGPSL
jgi:hypothetical protein